MAEAARQLSEAVQHYAEEPGPEAAPTVLNPLDYAWELHEAYATRFAPAGAGQIEAVFMGMNPGPWGMAQSGVPFGTPDLVQSFLGLEGEVRPPANAHPKRPILGLESPRSEVSGQRLWGGIEACFGTPEAFFERFFVLNYCPLVFQNERGANVVPEKLPAAYLEGLLLACDTHLRDALELLAPRALIAVGKWAEKQARPVAEHLGIAIHSILHPSPASPIANRGWLPQARAQLEALGYPWPEPAEG